MARALASTLPLGELAERLAAAGSITGAALGFAGPQACYRYPRGACQAAVAVGVSVTAADGRKKMRTHLRSRTAHAQHLSARTGELAARVAVLRFVAGQAGRPRAQPDSQLTLGLRNIDGLVCILRGAVLLGTAQQDEQRNQKLP